MGLLHPTYSHMIHNCLGMCPGHRLSPLQSGRDTCVNHGMHKNIDENGFELIKHHYFECLSKVFGPVRSPMTLCIVIWYTVVQVLVLATVWDHNLVAAIPLGIVACLRMSANTALTVKLMVRQRFSTRFEPLGPGAYRYDNWLAHVGIGPSYQLRPYRWEEFQPDYFKGLPEVFDPFRAPRTWRIPV